jgi:adenosine deaminase
MITLEQALIENSISKLMLIPKSDIHTHGGKGGMQYWFKSNIKLHDNGIEGYLKRVEAAFLQAKEDNIAVLSLSFSIEVIDFLGGFDSFINILSLLNESYAPETQYFPELSLSRECDVDKVYDRVEETLSKNWFKSIDICGNELAQPIKKFQKIYRMAQGYGVKLKAHFGEFGTADDVMEAVEILNLSEVHHGIAAVKSKNVMKWLSKHKIQLNVCPTSNIMLKRAPSYSKHPIKELFENKIPVTINTDDLLIFDSSVSEEYLKLYNNKVFTADELEIIRATGLASYK